MMMLLVMIGEPLLQYIPLLSNVAPVIVNPEIRALLVAVPSKVTVFVLLIP